MARYFFDTREGSKVIPDEEGLELRDDDQAREEATRGVACMVKHIHPPAGEQENVAVEVRDHNHRSLFRAAIQFVTQHLR